MSAFSCTASGIPDSRIFVGVLLDLGLHLIELAELLLYGLELLAKEVLPLRLGHLLLDPVLDLGAEFKDLEFLLQEPRRLLKTVSRIECLEDLLLVVDAQAQVERHEVGEAARLFDGGCRDQDFMRNGLAELSSVLEVSHQGAHERFGLDIDSLGLTDQLDSDEEERVGLQVLKDAEALLALDERLCGAVGELELLHHGRDTADLVDVLGAGVLCLGLALRGQRDEVALSHRLFERLDRSLPTDEQRHHEVGKQAQVPERDERQYVGNDGRLATL